MKLKDIIFLVAAIVAWLYSSYRSYQKQEAAKTKPINENLPVPDEPIIPVPRAMTSTRKVQEKTVIQPRSIRNYETSGRRASPVSLETLISDINPGGVGFQGKLTGTEKKPVVNNIQSIEQKTSFSDHSVEELIEEIHSGKVDWRKAIILNELIRPVYF